MDGELRLRVDLRVCGSQVMGRLRPGDGVGGDDQDFPTSLITAAVRVYGRKYRGTKNGNVTNFEELSALLSAHEPQHFPVCQMNLPDPVFVVSRSSD
jgi:hypothetical protein